MRIISSQQSDKRARIEPLAVLPVFYKLDGQAVLLAGGSDAAAWKGELLAASGATVHVYAEEFDPLFDEIIARSREGAFVLHKRPWAADSFHAKRIAICDAETEGEAKAFYCAAKAAGVAVNVIDKPAFCEFQFGSIVNRSPAIVSISTDGAAPILGQAIRRRIETLLPKSLAEWAGLARDIRAEVTDRLKPGAERRSFWERFVDMAFSGNGIEQAEEKLLRHSHLIADGQTARGRVTLVGAGPGDAELLTLKAVRALQSADVILFDDLVSDDVLELARREAKRMLVGKRGGRESCKQQDINDMMVTFANAGKHVVRLKGGDPMVFGRAGEEIARLRQENIEVSVVPGITSALAMASRLGVTLTHRDMAQSVRFVTGHSRHGGLPTDVDWASVADPRTTTIFYMGGRMAADIAQTLADHGLSRETPAVMMSAIARQDEKSWAGELGELSAGAQLLGLDNPVLIGVGHVFKDVNLAQNAPDLVVQKALAFNL